jgi:hypothetical protein
MGSEEMTGGAKPTGLLKVRADRLRRVIPATCRPTYDFPLVKGLKLSPVDFANLQGAAAAYVWQSLCAAFPDEVFPLSTDILTQAQSFVTRLPNRTPNGVVLPKAETFLSYNLVQHALVRTLRREGLIAPFSHFQVPCNVRIVDGDSAPAVAARAYASSKVHTDVWNGEPHHSILFNLPLLGDSQSVCMAFYEPSQFPLELAHRLDDYDLGQPVIDGATACDMPFVPGEMYVSDSFSLHQTVRRGPGIRLSLDFRALAVNVLADEDTDLGESHADYVPAVQWQATGSEDVLYSDEPMDSFLRRQSGEAVEVRTITLHQISDVN